jgi:dihydrofolate reductase
MRELIYHVATSLDNFICDVNGETAAFLPEGDHIPDFINNIEQYGAVLMGKRTYEYGFKYGLKPGESGYKGIKHYVFSSSFDFESTPDVELVQSDAVAFIRNLKQHGGKPLWLCGGGQLGGSLLQHELIDRLVLKVNPIFIFEGIPLFGSGRKEISLKPEDLKEYKSGVLRKSYRIVYH